MYGVLDLDICDSYKRERTNIIENSRHSKLIYIVHTLPYIAVKIFDNTPGTAGGPGGRDRTLAVKSRKNA